MTEKASCKIFVLSKDDLERGTIVSYDTTASGKIVGMDVNLLMTEERFSEYFPERPDYFKLWEKEK